MICLNPLVINAFTSLLYSFGSFLGSKLKSPMIIVGEASVNNVSKESMSMSDELVAGDLYNTKIVTTSNFTFKIWYCCKETFSMSRTFKLFLINNATPFPLPALAKNC